MDRARGTSSRRIDLVMALLVFAACLAAYVATLAPGLPHPAGDSHEFTVSAAVLRLARRTGYPLYTWLAAAFAHLLAAGDVAYRTNLLSAVLGAGGVAVLYLVGRRLDFAAVPAVLAALLFGATTTFWSQAVVTEVYAPNVFLLGLVLLALLAWAERATVLRFALFAFALGASLGTHLSNLVLAPVMALFALGTDPRLPRRGRVLLAGLGAFLAGVAQFVWLPLRAGTAQFPNPSPHTLGGVYAYTLGAFPNLRFAFPLEQAPGRLGVYVSLLLENVTPAGVLLGVAGMWALWWRRPAYCWLVVGLHCAAVVPASQMAVPDLEVFFIPGHYTWALLAGAGLHAAWSALARGGRVGRLLQGALAVVAACWIGLLARASFAANDRHLDTAYDDFVRSAYDVLPPKARLVVPPGVFGQGARYWQDVRGLRPDVETIGAIGGPALPLDPPPFSVLPVARGRLAPAIPQRVLAPDAWYVPRLLGSRQDLVLWRAQPRPPAALVTAVAPARRIDWWVDGMALVAATVVPERDAPTPRVHLRALWQADGAALPFVSTRVGDVTLETHELGLGLASRYHREVGPLGQGSLVEEFELVLPSTLPRGDHPLSLGVTRFSGTGMTVAWIEVGRVVVD